MYANHAKSKIGNRGETLRGNRRNTKGTVETPGET